VLLLRGDPQHASRAGRTGTLDHGRRVRVLGEQVGPGPQHGPVHQEQRPLRAAPGSCKVGLGARAEVQDRRLDASLGRGRGPGDRHGAQRQGERVDELEPGVALAPRHGQLERLGVHVVHARLAQRVHAPRDGPAVGFAARHPSADLVREPLQVGLERRGTQQDADEARRRAGGRFTGSRSRRGGHGERRRRRRRDGHEGDESAEQARALHLVRHLTPSCWRAGRSRPGGQGRVDGSTRDSIHAERTPRGAGFRRHVLGVARGTATSRPRRPPGTAPAPRP
jgi:hypothetical protein